MVAPAGPASLHLLTPGSPAYALLKVGAIGGVIALRFAAGRRGRAERESDAAGAEPEVSPRRDPHPVSRKKKRRRRR